MACRGEGGGMSRIFIGMGTCGLATAGQVKTAVEKWAAARGMPVEITPRAASATARPSPSWTWSLTPATACRTAMSPGRRGFILDEVLVRNNSARRAAGAVQEWENTARDIPLIEDHPYFRKQVKYVLRNCGVIDPESIADYRSHGGFKGFERAMGMTQEQVIQEVTRSGFAAAAAADSLRARNGSSPGLEEREEVRDLQRRRGRPGAFMDRSILEGDTTRCSRE